MYYHQIKNSTKNIPNIISKKTKDSLEDILTDIIKDSLINIYPLNTWKY